MSVGLYHTIPLKKRNPLKQPARINLGVLRWIHSVEPPGYGAAVKTHWANLVNVLDTHISTHI